MSEPHIILACLPYLWNCKNFSKLVEIWRSSDKTNLYSFFETRCTRVWPKMPWMNSLQAYLRVAASSVLCLNRTKKAVLSQRWPRNAPIRDLYMDALKFSGLPDYAHRYYSQHFSWAFVPIEAMNVRTKFEVRTSTRSWDNRGYPKNLGTPWIRPRSLFFKIFNGLLFGLAL